MQFQLNGPCIIEVLIKHCHKTCKRFQYKACKKTLLPKDREIVTAEPEKTNHLEQLTHISESSARILTKDSHLPLICRNSWASLQSEDEEYVDSKYDVAWREEEGLLAESWEDKDNDEVDVDKQLHVSKVARLTHENVMDNLEAQI